MIPADPNDSHQVNDIPPWFLQDAQIVSTDGDDEEEEDAPRDQQGQISQQPPPPFDPPYEGCVHETFRNIQEARDYVSRLNNFNDAFIAVPVAFLHTFNEQPRNPIYGYILHH